MINAKLSLLVIKTHQIDILRRFYGSLGIDLAEEQHGAAPFHYAGRAGDVLLEIYPLAEGVTSADTTTRLGFEVEKLDEVLEALQRFDTPVATKPQETHWGLRAVVRDPDGRALELYQR